MPAAVAVPGNVIAASLPTIRPAEASWTDTPTVPL